MTFDWTYDSRTHSWLTGTREDGCGVYREDGQWFFNVVHRSLIICWGGEALATREEAQAAAEKEFGRLEDEE